MTGSISYESMSEGKACSDMEFYWNFAFSENDSQSRHGEAWRKALGTRLSNLVSGGDRKALSDNDWLQLKIAMMDARGVYLGKLLRIDIDWRMDKIETAQLRQIKLIRHEPFAAIAPSLLLGEFVEALDRGKDTPGDRFAQRYAHLRKLFDPEKVKGIPILVTENLGDALTEVDGLTRMCIMYSRLSKGEKVPGKIDVLVGTSERIRDWPFYW